MGRGVIRRDPTHRSATHRGAGTDVQKMHRKSIEVQYDCIIGPEHRQTCRTSEDPHIKARRFICKII